MVKESYSNVLDPSNFIATNYSSIHIKQPERDTYESKCRFKLENREKALNYLFIFKGVKNGGHSDEDETEDEDEDEDEDEAEKENKYNFDSDRLSKLWDDIGCEDLRMKIDTSSKENRYIIRSEYIPSFSSPVGDIAVNIGERIACDYGTSIGDSCHPFAPR